MPTSLIQTGIQYPDNTVQTTGISINGPAVNTTIARNISSTFFISNFDSYITYTLSTTNGSVTRSNNIISYTPTANGIASFVINGKTIGNFIAMSANQQSFTTAGTYTWVAPANVTSVSVVCVGGGSSGGASSPFAAGGAGGGLGWKNNISVTPGASYNVVVGAGGTAVVSTGQGNAGETSYFINTSTVAGFGGGRPSVNDTPGTGGGYVGDGGGNGGNGGTVLGTSYDGGGGGGAGGYSGNGGAGSGNRNAAGSAGTGGGGGGGQNAGTGRGGGGGGVGLLGQGTNGAGGSNIVASGGGSGGTNGTINGSTGTPGVYGGGGGGNDGTGGSPAGGVGAVRIIWPGYSRSFPSTNTGNL